MGVEMGLYWSCMGCTGHMHKLTLGYLWDMHLLWEFPNPLVSLGQMRHLMAILDNSATHIGLYFQPTIALFHLSLRSGKVSDYIRRLIIDSLL